MQTLDIWVKIIFKTFTPAKAAIYQNLHTSALAGFLTYARSTDIEIFCIFQTSLIMKCGSLVYMYNQHFAKFFFGFSGWNLSLCCIYRIPIYNYWKWFVLGGAEKLQHQFLDKMTLFFQSSAQPYYLVDVWWKHLNYSSIRLTLYGITELAEGLPNNRPVWHS